MSLRSHIFTYKYFIYNSPYLIPYFSPSTLVDVCQKKTAKILYLGRLWNQKLNQVMLLTNKTFQDTISQLRPFKATVHVRSLNFSLLFLLEWIGIVRYSNRTFEQNLARVHALFHNPDSETVGGCFIYLFIFFFLQKCNRTVPLPSPSSTPMLTKTEDSSKFKSSLVVGV